MRKILATLIMLLLLIASCSDPARPEPRQPVSDFVPSAPASAMPETLNYEADSALAFPEYDSSKDYAKLGEELFLDGIGELFLHNTISEVTYKIGKEISMSDEDTTSPPYRLTEAIYENGAKLKFAFEGDEGEPWVYGIEILEPFEGKTKAGIGLGSTKTDVISAYSNELNANESSYNIYVAGKKTSGVVFTFSGDECVKIEFIYSSLY